MNSSIYSQELHGTSPISTIHFSFFPFFCSQCIFIKFPRCFHQVFKIFTKYPMCSLRCSQQHFILKSHIAWSWFNFQVQCCNLCCWFKCEHIFLFFTFSKSKNYKFDNVKTLKTQLVFPSKPNFCNCFEFPTKKFTQKSISSTPWL